jgi:hypothetical protein
MTRCPLCPREIKPGDDVRWEVIGWEKDRSQGGHNALELRRRTGSVAHALCVDKLKRVNAGQLDIMDMM